MAAGVVTIGKFKYAVGLYWENSPGSGRVAQIAKEAANQPGQQADFYSIRPGNKNGRIPQFGLSTAEAGQTAGMPVMAGCLASQIPGSWAGAFRLNEGIAVVVVRDDLIVPDGDLFFLDEAEARDRLIQEVGFGGLQSVYAPESWSIPSADTIPISLLLNERRDIKLQQVHIPKQVKIIAAAVGLVLVVVLGGFWLYQEHADQENALRLQQEEAMRRAQDAAKRLLPASMQKDVAPEPVYDRKWEKAPLAPEIIAACQKGLEQIPVRTAGWKLNPVKCTGSSIDVSWSREKGMTQAPENSSINETATKASRTITLPTLQPRGAETLADPDDILKKYMAQNWPGTLSVAADDPPPPPPQGYTGAWNPPPPPWVKRSFTLTVTQLPSNLLGTIGNLPGVVINSMNYSASGVTGTWAVEGIIYENRK